MTIVKRIMQNFEKRELRGGFSLIEIIIVVAMSSLVIFVVSSFGENLGVLHNLIGQKLQSRSDVDQAMQIMTTEIRSASPSSMGAYAINAASTSSFSFYSDIDRDGLFERVRYFFATSTIQKGVVKPSGSPLQYVTSTEIVTTAANYVLFTSSTQLFKYYGANYTGSESPLTLPIDLSQIRVVKTSFYSDVNPGKSPQPLFFSNTIDLRNLRSN